MTDRRSQEPVVVVGHGAAFADPGGETAHPASHTPQPRFAQAQPLSRTASAADWWATVVLALAEAPLDPKCLRTFAELLNMSVGTLRMRCYAAGVAPKASLDFARLFRLVHLSRSGEWEPQAWLSVADVRTLARLLAGGGLPMRAERPPTLTEFIGSQCLIGRESSCLRMLRIHLEHLRATAPGVWC